MKYGNEQVFVRNKNMRFKNVRFGVIFHDLLIFSLSRHFRYFLCALSCLLIYHFEKMLLLLIIHIEWHASQAYVVIKMRMKENVSLH